MKKVYNFNVAGTSFGRRQGFLCNLETTPNAKLFLKRERKNDADSNAIKVIVKNDNGKCYDIGYVPRKVAAVMAPAMDAGAYVFVDSYKVVGGKGLTRGVKLSTHWFVADKKDEDVAVAPAAPIAAVPAYAMA